MHEGKKSTIVADCVGMKANPISRFISGTRDLHHHHYSPLYRSLCLSLWDNSPCDFTYSRLQFTSKWKEDPAEDCLSTHSYFFFLSSFLLVLFCFVGELGWKQTLLYILPPFQIPLLQTADVGSWPQQLFKLSAWSRRRGKSKGKKCMELLPISCKHRMSSSHTEISDHKNSKTCWGKEGRIEDWGIMKEKILMQCNNWFIVGL